VAEDASGVEIQRWKLISCSRERDTLPGLDASWPEFARLDLRALFVENARLPPVVAALAALRERDWFKADQSINLALEAQPDQPFVNLLKAWSLSQQGQNPSQVVTLLKQVAAGNAPALAQAIADGLFREVSSDKVHEILLAQSETERHAEDWDRLAVAATRSNRPRLAIEHYQAAIRAAGGTNDDFRRELALVRLLIEVGEFSTAVERSNEWAARRAVPPEQVLSLAELLHDRNDATAQSLVRQALADRAATGERRYRLLFRRADLEAGLIRWRTLIEAMHAVPDASPLRTSARNRILSELTDPAQIELAAQLELEANDEPLQVLLLLRRAELCAAALNRDDAANIAWSLYRTNRLPTDRFDWLSQRLSEAEKHDRLITVIESRLRSGSQLSQDRLHWLASAYSALGRPIDAARARTNDADLAASQVSR
jgi:hypothetical protein